MIVSNMIVHGCHHKSGTHWFRKILRSVARKFGLSFAEGAQANLTAGTQIFFQDHSRIDCSLLGDNYVMTHMIRDPRDMIVSGYYYHRYAKEKWLHLPKKRFDGRSYQEQLNKLSPEKGMLLEIKCARGTIAEMANWKYDNPRVLELKYEEVITAQEFWFNKIFKHYGFPEEVLPKLLKIADKYSFQRRSRRNIGQVKEKSHLRSGASGQWQSEFGAVHKACFKEHFGDVLIKLGYESDTNW